MRTLKYQAWYNGKMYTVRTMRFEDTGVSLVYLERAGERGITCDDIAHMTLREFTGLYDKHGNEIYEGDVVSLVYGKHILEVRRGLFSFQFFEIAQQEQKLVYAADMRRLEVIGNIYEGYAGQAQDTPALSPAL